MPHVRRWWGLIAALGLIPFYEGAFAGSWIAALAIVTAALVWVPIGHAWLDGRGKLTALGPVRRPLLRFGITAAGILLLVSFLVSRGPLAGALAAPWLFVSLAGAVAGAASVVRGGVTTPRDLLLASALIFLAVGGIAVVIARAGLEVLDFSPEIIWLTGVHFHYAGYVLPLIAALWWERYPTAPSNGARAGLRRWAGLFVTSGIVGATPLLAAGITASPRLEWIAVAWLTAALATFALLLIAGSMGNVARPALAALDAGAGVALLFSMSLAVAYGWGELRGEQPLSILTMLGLHGFTNAFAFTGCGMCGALVANGREKTETR